MNNVDFSRYSKKIVRYLWDPEPANDENPDTPIWCLGKQYATQNGRFQAQTKDQVEPLQSAPVEVKNPADSVSSLPQEDQSPAQTVASDASQQKFAPPQREQSFEEVSKQEADTEPFDGDGGRSAQTWPSDFLDDFESRIWLTYRSGFPPIPRSADPKATSHMSFSVRMKSLAAHEGFKSDTGWGCMIRSGQCLLANALVLLRFGRDWRREPNDPREPDVLRLFADDPGAPFSIHSFVQHGAAACGTFPGQWFGPSATAKCIEALVSRHQEVGLRAYVTGDGPEVYERTMFEIAKADKDVFNPTLLLVGTRLGIDQVTPAYWEALKAAVQLPQSIGIAGGRPSSSHYFVGVQGSHFFYLDPHVTRPALSHHSDASKYSLEEIATCHTRRLRRLTIEEMDPSMLIAFLIRSEVDWYDWKQRISQTVGKPIVHVSDRDPSLHGSTSEREEAVDEVETFDDDDINGSSDGMIDEYESHECVEVAKTPRPDSP
ncbi:MAG: hypothetical protein Q9162_005464 [Coniocarpon cinnabarinum]